MKNWLRVDEVIAV